MKTKNNYLSATLILVITLIFPQNKAYSDDNNDEKYVADHLVIYYINNIVQVSLPIVSINPPTSSHGIDGNVQKLVINLERGIKISIVNTYALNDEIFSSNKALRKVDHSKDNIYMWSVFIKKNDTYIIKTLIYNFSNNYLLKYKSQKYKYSSDSPPKGPPRYMNYNHVLTFTFKQKDDAKYVYQIIDTISKIKNDKKPKAHKTKK